MERSNRERRSLHRVLCTVLFLPVDVRDPIVLSCQTNHLGRENTEDKVELDEWSDSGAGRELCRGLLHATKYAPDWVQLLRFL